MGIFKKNINEQEYVGGKKHWIDVIKNSGTEDMIIWKQPEEDFNTNSTLVVMPGEEAIFIKGGVIEQVFENGTYILSTNNYPFISRLRNMFSGGVSTFNCVVYFVRKTVSKEIRWGTETPILVRDKVWGVRTDAKVRGAYKVMIENPGKFLEKLIGNTVLFKCEEDLNDYFASEFQGKIKTAVSKFLNSIEHELIGIDAYIDEISQKIEPYIDEILSDYGLKCIRFSLAGLDIDKTKYDVIDESQMELIAKTRGYQADKAGLDILGNDWGRVQGVDVLKDLANNPGTGGIAATGAGIGMGMGAAGTFGSIAQQVFSPVQNITESQQSTNQINGGNISRYVQKNNSNQQAANNDDPIEILSKLKKMLDAGLIEQAEYDNKKNEILSKM